MNQLKTLFTTGSGRSLILLFIGGGISALVSHGVSVPADITTVIALIGGLLHPQA